MKKHLKFVFLAPLFMAVLCDPNDDTCLLEEPEAYVINVENITETYTTEDTIWLNAKTSAMLIDNCNDTQESVFIDDPGVFIDGVFILKLNNQAEQNAQVVTDANVNFDIGEPFSFNSCLESITCLPELTEDNQFYQYRIGISINTPGDYCIVNAINNALNPNIPNNAQIFETYNTLEDKIIFQSCNTTFTRNGTDGHYFFTVQ